MSNCDFCDSTYNVDKIKIKGIRKFKACEKCQKILNSAVLKSGEDYFKQIENLEANLNTPKKLLDLLYILPHYKKCGTNLKLRKNYFLKYLDNYKKSNLTSSIICQISIFAFLNFIYFNVCLGIMSYWKIFVISFSLSFLIGVILLNTGVTAAPCKNMYDFFEKIINFFCALFKKIKNIRFKNFWLDFFVCFFRLIFYFLNCALVITFLILSILMCCFVAVLHAMFLFIPAYYIDYKRRHKS